MTSYERAHANILCGAAAMAVFATCAVPAFRLLTDDRPHAMAGVVVDAATHQPVPGARMHLRGPEDPAEALVAVVPLVSAADGRFQVVRPERGSILVVNVPGYETYRRELTDVPASGVIALEPAASAQAGVSPVTSAPSVSP